MTPSDSDRELTYTIDLLPGTDIALLHCIGPVTLEDRIDSIDVIRDFCRENGVYKVIIDGRDQESKTGTLESYEFGARVPTALPGLWMAVVHRPDDDSLRLIETVAFNRGSGTKAFDDLDQARAWLESLEGPADEPTPSGMP